MTGDTSMTSCREQLGRVSWKVATILSTTTVTVVRKLPRASMRRSSSWLRCGTGTQEVPQWVTFCEEIRTFEKSCVWNHISGLTLQYLSMLPSRQTDFISITSFIILSSLIVASFVLVASSSHLSFEFPLSSLERISRRHRRLMYACNTISPVVVMASLQP